MWLYLRATIRPQRTSCINQSSSSIFYTTQTHMARNSTSPRCSTSCMFPHSRQRVSFWGDVHSRGKGTKGGGVKRASKVCIPLQTQSKPLTNACILLMGFVLVCECSRSLYDYSFVDFNKPRRTNGPLSELSEEMWCLYSNSSSHPFQSRC